MLEPLGMPLVLSANIIKQYFKHILQVLINELTI